MGRIYTVWEDSFLQKDNFSLSLRCFRFSCQSFSRYLLGRRTKNCTFSGTQVVCFNIQIIAGVRVKLFPHAATKTSGKLSKTLHCSARSLHERGASLTVITRHSDIYRQRYCCKNKWSGGLKKCWGIFWRFIGVWRIIICETGPGVAVIALLVMTVSSPLPPWPRRSPSPGLRIAACDPSVSSAR